MKIISSKYYYENDIYSLEKKTIFEREWLFAGLRKDIPGKRDLVTFDVFGRSVIIYNNGTEKKRFKMYALIALTE